MSVSTSDSSRVVVVAAAASGGGGVVIVVVVVVVVVVVLFVKVAYPVFVFHMHRIEPALKSLHSRALHVH